MKFSIGVVLGARIDPDGNPGPALLRRLARAVALADHHQGKMILILSGGRTAGSTKPSEAEVMEQIALRAGLPAELIHKEECARNTRENALYGLWSAHRCHGEAGPIAQALNPLPELTVITEWPHIPRAWWVFQVLAWRGHRMGLWPRRRIRCAAAAGPRFPGVVGFVARETLALACDLVRIWRVPLKPRHGIEP